MVGISRKTYQKNAVEKVLDSDGIFLLNEKHTKEGLSHKNLCENTIKYNSDHRKHRYELVDEPKSNTLDFQRWKISNQNNYESN